MILCSLFIFMLGNLGIRMALECVIVIYVLVLGVGVGVLGGSSGLLSSGVLISVSFVCGAIIVRVFGFSCECLFILISMLIHPILCHSPALSRNATLEASTYLFYQASSLFASSAHSYVQLPCLYLIEFLLLKNCWAQLSPKTSK